MFFTLETAGEKPSDMTNEEWERVESSLQTVGKFAGLLKTIIGAGAIVVTSLVGMLLWVHTVTNGLAQVQDAQLAADSERKMTITQWTEWRRVKDETDIRMVTAIENMQRLLERQQSQIDRIEVRNQGQARQ